MLNVLDNMKCSNFVSLCGDVSTWADLASCVFRRVTTSPLRESSEWTKLARPLCSTASCTRCPIIDLVKCRWGAKTLAGLPFSMFFFTPSCISWRCEVSAQREPLTMRFCIRYTAFQLRGRSAQNGTSTSTRGGGCKRRAGWQKCVVSTLVVKGRKARKRAPSYYDHGRGEDVCLDSSLMQIQLHHQLS